MRPARGTFDFSCLQLVAWSLSHARTQRVTLIPTCDSRRPAIFEVYHFPLGVRIFDEDSQAAGMGIVAGKKKPQSVGSTAACGPQDVEVPFVFPKVECYQPPGSVSNGASRLPGANWEGKKR